MIRLNFVPLEDSGIDEDAIRQLLESDLVNEDTESSQEVSIAILAIPVTRWTFFLKKFTLLTR